MHYICLVYNEPDELAQTTEKELAEVCKDCGDWVRALESSNRHVFSAGLQSFRTATTIRRRNGEIVVSDGPFSETKEVLGGFTILEARDLNEAIHQATKLALICKGDIEVRPIMDPFQEMSDPVDQKLASAIRSSIKAAAHEEAKKS